MGFQVYGKTYDVCIHSGYTQDTQSEISRQTASKLLNGIIIMVLVQILFFKCFVPVGGNIVLNFRN